LYDGPRTIVALPLPSGTPASFAGAVGSGLRVTRRVDGEPRAGEGLTLEVTVAGRGNAALWPAPELIWPAGVRAYPDGASESVDVIEGRLGGSKSFRFAVVPSRAGALALPRVVYPYFDPDAEAYREARLDAGTVAVRPADPRQLRGPRLTLLAPERIALTRRVARRIPNWGWVLLVLLPVTLPWLRRRRAPSVPPRQRVPADLRFTRMLIELAGNGDDRALAATLRARGMIAADAAAALRTRDALAEAAYGPSAGGVSPSLAQEAERLADALEALQPPPRTWVDRAGRAGLGLVALVAVGSLAALQSDGAEAAFARGEFTTAAAKFAARAARTPDAAAAWYNLGASSLGAGDETAAIGAFVRAARRDPRSPDIRAALQLSPTTDRAARDARAVLPITPDEAASIGLLCWWLGWIVVRLGWRRRRSAAVAASLLLGLGGAALSAAAWLRWRESRPMALVRQATVLRRSPHERGERLGDLQLGAAVAVVQRRAGWCLVRGPVGEGWVVTAQLVALAE
jgi:tetratricopeptide (TPR) repeat protein